MTIRENKLIKFVGTAFEVAKKSVPGYSSRFSRHDYTLPQLTALSCLKTRLGRRYRDFVDELELMPGVVEELELKKVPHFTTLQKFLRRLGTTVFDRILSETVLLFDIGAAWIALDGTGHSCSHASMYYAKRLKKQKKRRRKNYTKNQIAVDTRTQAIIDHRVAKGPRHDAKDAIPLIRRSYQAVHAVGYSMDKGYDDEEIHKVAREEAGAECMIPLRKKAKKGKYRLRMLTEFDEDKYHKRSLSETVFSVKKRVLGDVNYSRSDRMRNKETKLRNICYNIHRKITLLIAEILKDFYRAQI